MTSLEKGTIAKIVRYHRKKSGLSQLELAKLAGIGKTAVFDIENGKITIQLETLLKIFHILNIKIHFSSPIMNKFEQDENS